MASGCPSGSVNCICIFIGISMAGLSSTVHITVTLDPARPRGLIRSLIRVTETGCMTAEGDLGNRAINSVLRKSMLKLTAV